MSANHLPASQTALDSPTPDATGEVLLSPTPGVLILNTTVTIGYRSPWPQVHKALNDYYDQCKLNTYTGNANDMHVPHSELHTAIQISFQKAGIEIMSPAYTSLRDGSKNNIPETSISR